MTFILLGGDIKLTLVLVETFLPVFIVGVKLLVTECHIVGTVFATCVKLLLPVVLLLLCLCNTKVEVAVFVLDVAEGDGVIHQSVIVLVALCLGFLKQFFGFSRHFRHIHSLDATRMRKRSVECSQTISEPCEEANALLSLLSLFALLLCLGLDCVHLTTQELLQFSVIVTLELCVWACYRRGSGC